MNKRDDKIERDALWFLMESMAIGDTGQAIVNQEKRGQAQFAAEETLPREGLTDMLRKQLEAIGFVFGGDVDELFIHAKLPSGWKKVPTSHHMHTDIVDDKGRRRGGVFYKAAFYDRKASVSFGRRYSATHHADGADKWAYADGTVMHGYVYDRETLIYTTPESAVRGEGNWGEIDKLDALATTWLTEHYPDWQNPFAYWD